MRIRAYNLVVLVVVLFAWQQTRADSISAQQQEPNKQKDLFEMSIEELMDVEVTPDSQKSEPLVEAPSVISVVPREGNSRCTATSLFHLLQRQPCTYTREAFNYSDDVVGFRGELSVAADVLRRAAI